MQLNFKLLILILSIVMTHFCKLSKKSGAKSIKQMSIKNQLTYKEHLKLSNLCKRFNIDYLCSAFDLKSLKFLITKIKVKKIKIPSGEITSIDLLEYLSKKKMKSYYPQVCLIYMKLGKQLKN